MDKYINYQTEDFLRDESFINWVLDPDGANNQAWTIWMNSAPAKKEAAQKAIDLIRSFDFRKEPVTDEFYAGLKHRIDHTIAAGHTVPLNKKPVIQFWMKAAIVIAAVLISALVFYYRKPSYTYFSTPYAAIKTVWLPDSSEVVLNANSSIRFKRGHTNNKREVWITGEAFFKVRHIEIDGKAQPFAVYAGDAVIEVLGTEFNVKNVNNNTSVLLQQGKVRFSIPASHSQTIMQPNDYCQYDAQQGKIIRSYGEQFDALRPIRAGEIGVDWPDGRQLLEDSGAFLQILEFVHRQANILSLAPAEVVAYKYNFFGIWKREWAQQHRVNHAEDRGVRANTEAQGNNSYGSEARSVP